VAIEKPRPLRQAVYSALSAAVAGSIIVALSATLIGIALTAKTRESRDA